MNITYLFGAGASIETIPAVTEFKRGVRELLGELNHKNRGEGAEELKKTLASLFEDLPKYASIDTLIRKLHIQGNPYATELNAALIAVIHYLQITKPIDKRYDLFLGNLLSIENGKVLLPSNVNFISWNYDRLFESSLASLLRPYGDLNLVREYVNIFNNYETSESENNPYLIKLNGSAGAYIDLVTNSANIEEKLNDVLQNYVGSRDEKIPNSLIQFAWDETEFTKKSREKAIEIMSKTNILVVIGYSFPTFNRYIDKNLLSPHPKLDRIVIQNTSENIESVCDRLLALTPYIEIARIKKVTDKTEFHMPIEI